MLEAGERGRETQKNGVVKNFTSPTKEEKKQATQDANAKKAAAQAGKKFKANSSYVSHVKKIKVEAPETFEKIKSGELTVGDAKREVKKRQQKKAREQAIASSPEIQVKAWDGKGSLVGFVISQNINRRHLSPAQKAAVAVEALPFFEAEAKERQREAGKTYGKGKESNDSLVQNYTNLSGDEKKQASQAAISQKAATQVAKGFGASPSYVYQVKAIKEASPELFQQVKTGVVSMGDAKREVKKAQQAEARREAIASSPEIQVKAWDGTIKPNTVSLCSVFDLKLPADSVDMIFTDPPYHDEYLSLYPRFRRDGKPNAQKT